MKLASLRNREAEQLLHWSPCWAREQYLLVAFPEFVLLLYFTLLLLKVLCSPVVQAALNKQKPWSGVKPTVLWAAVGDRMYCRCLLAKWHKQIITMSLAELLEGCKNPHTEAVAEIQKALQVPFEESNFSCWVSSEQICARSSNARVVFWVISSKGW